MIMVPPFPCAVCGRAGCGIFFKAPEERADFCSFKCSEVWMVARAANIELTKDEKAAALAGGKAAGAFLEKIGKTDLAELTKAEWAELCETLVAGAFTDLQQQADKWIPF